MQCEKCGDDRMEPVGVFRSSGCLVASGFGLIIISLAALGAALLLTLLGPSASRQSTANWNERAMAKAVSDLGKIPDLPASVVAEFKREGKVSDRTLAQLSFEQRTGVSRVVADHAVAMLSENLGGATAAGVGVVVIVVLLVGGVPGTIVGLLLVRRRKVWRCRACGYAFDRL